MAWLSVTLDLAQHLRPGDRITGGQTCAEPATLVEQLISQADRIGDLHCFVGIPAASALTVDTVPDGLTVHSYCGSGSNATLHAAGRLEVWPVHYSTLPAMLSAGGAYAADVVFVQVSPPDDQGRHSLGLADDYFSAAIDTARVVIAEINDFQSIAGQLTAVVSQIASIGIMIGATYSFSEATISMGAIVAASRTLATCGSGARRGVCRRRSRPLPRDGAGLRDGHGRTGAGEHAQARPRVSGRRDQRRDFHWQLMRPTAVAVSRRCRSQGPRKCSVPVEAAICKKQQKDRSR